MRLKRIGVLFGACFVDGGAFMQSTAAPSSDAVESMKRRKHCDGISTTHAKSIAHKMCRPNTIIISPHDISIPNTRNASNRCRWLVTNHVKSIAWSSNSKRVSLRCHLVSAIYNFSSDHYYSIEFVKLTKLKHNRRNVMSHASESKEIRIASARASKWAENRVVASTAFNRITWHPMQMRQPKKYKWRKNTIKCNWTNEQCRQKLYIESVRPYKVIDSLKFAAFRLLCFPSKMATSK